MTSVCIWLLVAALTVGLIIGFIFGGTMNDDSEVMLGTVILIVTLAIGLLVGYFWGAW